MKINRVAWVASAMLFQAIVAVLFLMLTRSPYAAMPELARIAPPCQCPQDSVAQQEPDVVRLLPPAANDLTEVPDCCADTSDIPAFVEAMEIRLAALNRHVLQAWQELSGRDLAPDEPGTFVHVFYYFGRACDGLSLIRHLREGPRVLEASRAVVADYLSAVRAVQVASYRATEPPAALPVWIPSGEPSVPDSGGQPVASAPIG